MSTTDTRELPMIVAEQSVDDQRTPVAGVMGLMAAFSGAGATYVALTRDDAGVVTQMGVVAALCGVIALAAARQHR